MRVPLPLTIGAATALIALAACGGSAATTQPTAGGTSPASATSSPAGATSSSAGTAVACGGSGTATAATIANFAFSPNPVTVSSGAAVTWTNNDSTTHTVTFDAGPDCGNVASGASVTVAFSAPGSYAYHCKIHPSMTGAVTVNG